MTLDTAKAKTIDLLTCKPQNLAARRFSVFVGGDLAKATALTERWMQLTAQHGDAALDDVVADAEQEMALHDSDLVKHALLMFITHDAIGRQLPIPSLVEREPEAVQPSLRSLNLPPAGIETLGGTGAEAALDYFREDTAFNEHHAKWHVVYPAGGINGKLRNRQGELFWYMHQQMLARYDAERLSVGMAAVVPLDSFDDLIPEGYDPEIPGGWQPRVDDSAWPMLTLDGVQPYGPKQHAERRERLLAAARSGKLKHPTKGDIDITGPEMMASTVESNIGGVQGTPWDPYSFNGSYHNVGHVLLAAAGDPNADGVMASTTTAVRDPVFYRWHRHVDDVIDTWWQTRPPHDLAKSDPGVRADEIAVIARGALPQGADAQAWAEAQFGGAAAPANLVVDELRTMMGAQQVGLQGGGSLSKPHLDHEDFYWLLRCENPTAKDIDVTFRIFLAVEALADGDRRAWIEMDKFTDKVAAGSRYLKMRSARDAAVVRKPALRPGDPVPPPTPGADPNYCDCGWPYHLLVPRGSTGGMAFRIMVLLTDWATDQVRDEKKHKCGSLSFCGARDTDYPDKQEMGYPFNRPIDLAALAQRPNVASRTITIRHTP